MKRLVALGVLGGLLYSLTRPRRAASSSSQPQERERPIDIGPIESEYGDDSPTVADYVGQTAPESFEVIEFGGFTPQLTQTPYLQQSVYDASRGYVIQIPAASSQGTRDLHPGTMESASAYLSRVELEQTPLRDEIELWWYRFRVLSVWLKERGIYLVFQPLGEVPPLEWDQGAWRESRRDLDVLAAGLGLLLDPILFTIDKRTALSEGRIFLDGHGDWYAVSQRRGAIVRERVPVAPPWGYTPPIDSPEFRADPRWLMRGDSAKVLLTPMQFAHDGSREPVPGSEPNEQIQPLLAQFVEWRG